MAYPNMRAMCFPTGAKKAKEYIIENLNESNYMGCNVYYSSLLKKDIEYYKANPTLKDWHMEALDYAQSLNMKVVFTMSVDEYGAYEFVFENTTGLLDQYLSGVQWGLNRYKNHPAFMGVFLHEVYWHQFTSDEVEILRRQSIINNIWVRARTIFDIENINGNLELIANYGSNTRCNSSYGFSIDCQGLDGNYVSNNFTQKEGQCRTEWRTGPNVLNKPLYTAYQVACTDSMSDNWKIRLPGLPQIRGINSALSSHLKSADCLAGILTACRNQSFFDSLVNSINRNEPWLIFSMYSVRNNSSPNTYWSSYNNITYPGDGADEKIRNILSGNIPPPPLTGTLDIDSVPQGASIRLQYPGETTWGNYGTTPRIKDLLPPGNYTCELTLAEYNTDIFPFTISAGNTTYVNRTLVPINDCPTPICDYTIKVIYNELS